MSEDNQKADEVREQIRKEKEKFRKLRQENRNNENTSGQVFERFLE